MRTNDAYVLAGGRTAIGTAFKGSLAEVSAYTLAQVVVEDVVKRSGVSPDTIDDLVLGEVMHGGGNIARHTALSVGLNRVPGLAQQRQCASGMSAITTAAGSVMAGMDQAVIAGGVESSSTRPASAYRTPGTDEWKQAWQPPSHPATPTAPTDDMSITVGWNTARLGNISRSRMDEWALRSHRRAIDAIDHGLFREEIVPVQVTRPDGTKFMFDVDEHPRRTTTAEKLAALPPLHPEIDGFSITAGNSSGINDGAAALLIANREQVDRSGIEPLGVIRSWASIGVDPERTGMAPALVIPEALRRAGVHLEDVSLVEVNEAFASVAVHATDELGLDPEIVNVNGSGCSLGHPVAATGTRLVLHLLHELRRRGERFGVASLCAGGGMGSAVVVEAL